MLIVLDAADRTTAELQRITAQRVLDRYTPLLGIQVGVFWTYSETVLLEFGGSASAFEQVSVTVDDTESPSSTPAPVVQLIDTYDPATSALFDFPNPVILVLDSRPLNDTSAAIAAQYITAEVAVSVLTLPVNNETLRREIPNFDTNAAIDNLQLITCRDRDGPLVLNDLPVLTTRVGEGVFEYQIPADTFWDEDYAFSLDLITTTTDGGPLPTWIGYDQATTSLVGVPFVEDVGALSLLVRAGNGNTSTTGTRLDIIVQPSLGVALQELTFTIDATLSLDPIVVSRRARRQALGTVAPTTAVDVCAQAFNSWHRALTVWVGSDILNVSSADVRLMSATAGVDANGACTYSVSGGLDYQRNTPPPPSCLSWWSKPCALLFVADHGRPVYVSLGYPCRHRHHKLRGAGGKVGTV